MVCRQQVGGEGESRQNAIEAEKTPAADAQSRETEMKPKKLAKGAKRAKSAKRSKKVEAARQEARDQTCRGAHEQEGGRHRHDAVRQVHSMAKIIYDFRDLTF